MNLINQNEKKEAFQDEEVTGLGTGGVPRNFHALHCVPIRIFSIQNGVVITL